MEFLTAEVLWSLFAIILIDLVLAGDNAIVIGMAARNLPAEQQKKAIFWGTFGAIAIRAAATFLVVWLLEIPALMLVGGALLLWIAYNLLVEGKKQHELEAHSNFRDAVKTIVIADGVMGIDNVIGVAGVAHGDMFLVIIGMLITVPIIVWGSTLFIKVVDRYPIVVYIGGAVLAWTAGTMITGDPLMADTFTTETSKTMVNVGLTAALLAIAFLINRSKRGLA